MVLVRQIRVRGARGSVLFVLSPGIYPTADLSPRKPTKVGLGRVGYIRMKLSGALYPEKLLCGACRGVFSRGPAGKAGGVRRLPGARG